MSAEPPKDDFDEDEDMFEDDDLDEDEVDDEDEDDEGNDDDENDGEGEEDVDASTETVVAGAKQVSDESKQGPPTPENIKLPVIVEVGRIQMTVDTLLKLEPGNLLDLNIQPEAGVDLVVNGNRVGKGELIQVGEMVGVRVLEIG